MPILSVNLLLDQDIERDVTLLQRSLTPEGVTLPQKYPPHITLAAYQIGDDAGEEHLARLPLLTRNQWRFPILLECLGIFPETGVLFLAPRISQALLSIHQATIDQFTSPVLDEYLLPGRWTPHVTIVASSSTDHLLSALAKALKSWRPIRGEAVGIGMRIHPATTHSGQSLFAS